MTGANGRRLVDARIRAQNIGTFLAKFDYLEQPSWSVSNFDVDKAVDDLFGLRIFNVAVALSVSKPSTRKRKIGDTTFKLYKESH